MAPPVRYSDDAAVAASVEKHLACPLSHRPLTADGSSITCADSNFTGYIREGVAVMVPAPKSSFFDERYEIMQKSQECEGGWDFGYKQQTALFSASLNPGDVVLDIGCGPSLPYRKPEGVFIVGLEPSFQSIRANSDVDLRVCANGTSIPMGDRTVDRLVCFYSIHHMVGATKGQTGENVAACFREFGRVLKPGGMLFVFEMTPMLPFSILQELFWNAMRRLAPTILDMYFWSTGAMTEMGRRHLPAGTVLETIRFRSPAFTMFPPMFSLPWFKVPRMVYPLYPKLYKWRLP